MSGGRIALLLFALASSLVALPGAASAHDGTTLRGFGTPTIDGTLSPGEWDAAGQATFNVVTSDGRVVPATVYAMNDTVNLYMALRVTGATVGSSLFEVRFDNDHSGNVGTEGDDAVSLADQGFEDYFLHYVASNAYMWVDDIGYGGTRDGAGFDDDSPGFSFYELAHPLDDPDNGHDFSLAVAKRVGFTVVFRHCTSTCSPLSEFPRGNMADIRVISGTRVPPDTQITSGPAEGAVLARNSTRFEFVGSDDIVGPGDLTFECKVDDRDFAPCTSPFESFEEDGRHTFLVRAVDEAANVDTTPAQRTWTIDRTPPTRPRVIGPRTSRSRTPLYRFSSRDAVTPASRIRYRCAFDSRRLRACRSRYRQRLRPGRHTLRVQARDLLGNASAIAIVHVRVRAARR